ncbi:ferredoxin, partial [Acidithiobacillus ferrooxidans]|nr:ferredoxin [Acidithiobacillus ferrooxidans]
LGKLPAVLDSEGQKPWKGPYWRLACQCIVGTGDQFFVAF